MILKLLLHCLLAFSIAIENLEAILLPDLSVWTIWFSPPSTPSFLLLLEMENLAHSAFRFHNGMCGHGPMIYFVKYLVGPFNLGNYWFKFWEIFLDDSFVFFHSISFVLFALLSGLFPQSYLLALLLSFKFLNLFLLGGGGRGAAWSPGLYPPEPGPGVRRARLPLEQARWAAAPWPPPGCCSQTGPGPRRRGRPRGPGGVTASSAALPTT